MCFYSKYKYVPILGLKPAEMLAIEELPEKDKDLILPIFPLRKWANSKKLENSTKRIEKSIGKRFWIADIDIEALSENEDKKDNEAIKELFELNDPINGYEKWISFVRENESIIPSALLNDKEQFESQIDGLISLNRPIAIRFRMSGLFKINNEDFNYIFRILITKKFDFGLIIILDYGDVNRVNLLDYKKLSILVNSIHRILGDIYISISGTSFPYSFSGTYIGEIPIYERQIFNKVMLDCPNVNLIYSDRASTRALKNSGGFITPPRIDYPLKNDWRFIRKDAPAVRTENQELYQEAALDIMSSDYWDIDTPSLWGRQMIEKTAIDDPYGINSPVRATSVRINLHLYQQLHYFDDLSEIDTEEDWVD
ncbi:beta family protein [Photobacterium leiognathi]|uniref:beta family protein n=1 Tax=Photobacterium leiognathi TaxID=553611 RepID=UPI000D16A4A7|nr:beta family protein [Photobacterium leiognathi]PSW39345.1 protein beta [Photobacterium leiognathi subsp. mandapamensis]